MMARDPVFGSHADACGNVLPSGAHAPNVTVSAVLRAVCEVFETHPGVVVGRSRRREHVTPRQVAIWIARHCVRINGRPISLPALGRAFGRDHTTVLSAIQRVDALLACDFEGLPARVRKVKEVLHVH
ncbi:MAG: hypothetical protein HQL36_08930 [Alphaproteobacteria bacterium]|nr:hypothetical protein [Alphaproteobacteria bacterium]